MKRNSGLFVNYEFNNVCLTWFILYINNTGCTSYYQWTVNNNICVYLLQAFIFQEQKKLFRQGMFHQCRDSYTAAWQSQLYSASSMLLLFVIPLIIMVTAYALILKTIIKTSRQFHGKLTYIFHFSHASTISLIQLIL